MTAPEIDIDEAARRLDEGSHLLDVRQLDEYLAGRVPGGQLVPLDELPNRWSEVPSDREVLVICRSGGRSAKAAEFLIQQGLTAVNVAGGTLAWTGSGRSIVTGRDGD